MLKSEIVAAARERADATRSGRWNDTDLGIMLGSVHWREWANILSSNPDYRLRAVSVSSNPSGVVAKSALSSPTAFTYRVRAVKSEGQFHSLTQFSDLPDPSMSADEGWVGKKWYESGESVQLIPARQTTATFWVNYRPKKASALSDVDNVDFPDGYEHVLVYGLAGEMLLKGGAETEAAADLMRFRDGLREDMLADIRRFSSTPTYVQPNDDASSWGSQ